MIFSRLFKFSSHDMAIDLGTANTVVYVRGDKVLEYGRVMQVMGLVGQAGFGKISLVAEGANPPPSATAAPVAPPAIAGPGGVR